MQLEDDYLSFIAMSFSFLFTCQTLCTANDNMVCFFETRCIICVMRWQWHSIRIYTKRAHD